MKIPSVTLTPIGLVESDFRDPAQRFDYQAEARLRIRPELEPALKGIEHFSHLWVIYHQHRWREWLELKGWGTEAPLAIPAGDDRVGQGVFCARFPCRPSLIGSCMVRLIRRDGALLTVAGLDALDGTPILDVKVYVPQFDAFPEATVPLHWAGVMNRPSDLADTARACHWDTTNVEFALGFRAGLIAMQQLGAVRAQALRSTVHGGLFFAQGWEAVTGCSPLRGTLDWHEKRGGPWSAELTAPGPGGARALLQVPGRPWHDAAEVMAAPDADIAQPLPVP